MRQYALLTATTHPHENVRLPENDQPDPRQKHLGELNIKHQIERSHVVSVHELVLVGSRSTVEAKGREQEQESEDLNNNNNNNGERWTCRRPRTEKMLRLDWVG